MFSKKTHDLLRKLAVLIGAMTAGLGVMTATLDLGVVGVVAMAVLSAASAFVSYIADHDSDAFFSSKDIVAKQGSEAAEEE